MMQPTKFISKTLQPLQKRFHKIPLPVFTDIGMWQSLKDIQVPASSSERSKIH